MCSRYRLVKEKIVITIRGREIEVSVRKRYNVAPQQDMPALPPDLLPVEMKWGWKPAWSNQLLINAKSETVLEKPTFKKQIGNRCLILADGFYEWTTDKTPVMFTKPDEQPFCFAGLWLETPERRFIILTTAPNDTVAPVHNRMPFIVQPAHYGLWLEAGDLFQTVLASPDTGELKACPVSRELNNVRNERPDLIHPGLAQNELF